MPSASGSASESSPTIALWERRSIPSRSPVASPTRFATRRHSSTRPASAGCSRPSKSRWRKRIASSRPAWQGRPRKTSPPGRSFSRALPSGLQYTVLTEGAGPKPTLDDVVEAHYRGTHVDGTEFDGTEPGGEPAAFPLRGVVPGWQEALPLMKAGSKWRVWLPAELGYGDAGSPPAIEPNEVLVFEIELVAIRPQGE